MDGAGALMLVSKQWQRVFLSTPVLHARLVLTVPKTDQPPEQAQRWLVRTRQQLQRVGHLCASLQVHTLMDGRPHPDCVDPLVGWLGSVPPSHLADLKINLPANPQLPASLGGWLGGATRLTALELASQRLGSATMPAVGGLTQLHHLRLWTNMAPAGLLDSLLRLTRLTHLALRAERLPDLQLLTELQQLRLWEVCARPPPAQEEQEEAEAEEWQPLVVPPPSAFPLLAAYRLDSRKDAQGLQVSWLLTSSGSERMCDARRAVAAHGDAWRHSRLCGRQAAHSFPCHLAQAGGCKFAAAGCWRSVLLLHVQRAMLGQHL